MTCDTMLDLMLEADLDELAGIGSSPVAAHVRACARCRKAAVGLLTDTRALAAAIAEPAPRSGRAPLRRAAIVTGALAAGVAGLAVLRLAAPTADADRRGSVARQAVDTAVAAPSATLAERPAPPVRTPGPSVEPRAEHIDDRPPARQAVASVPRPFTLPEPITPVVLAARRAAPGEMNTTTPPVGRGDVTVEPGLGKRATVFRAADAAITVVWFY